jgi:hypothetical protein
MPAPAKGIRNNEAANLSVGIALEMVTDTDVYPPDEADKGRNRVGQQHALCPLLFE